jgi:hypothetical protein
MPTKITIPTLFVSIGISVVILLYCLIRLLM